MKILLVEDDDLTRCIVADLLTDAGHEVVGTSDPREALRLPDPPIVLITDVDLGSEINGLNLAGHARQLWPEVRVIVISALADAQIMQSLDPRDHFVRKPFSRDAPYSARLRSVSAALEEIGLNRAHYCQEITSRNVKLTSGSVIEPLPGEPDGKGCHRCGL